MDKKNGFGGSNFNFIVSYAKRIEYTVKFSLTEPWYNGTFKIFINGTDGSIKLNFTV